MLSALVDKPLMQNPLAGGAMTSPQESQLQGDPLVQQMQMRMAQRDQKTPGFLAYFKDVMDTKGYPTKTMQEYESQFPGTTPQQVPLGANISNANFKTSPPGTLNVIDPNREARKKADEEFLKTADEFQRGFRESEFYKPNAPMTTDMAEFIYSSPTKGDITMKGSSSGIGQFGKYLKSIGKGDLLQRVGNQLSQETGPLQPSPGSFVPSVLPETLGGGTPTLITPEREESLRRSIIGNAFYDLNRNLGDSLLDGGINSLPEFGRSPSMFSNTGGIGSLIGFEPVDQTFNSQQAFNQQRFNEYVDSLVNERLKDFFGGIMGAIDV